MVAEQQHRQGVEQVQLFQSGEDAAHLRVVERNPAVTLNGGLIGAVVPAVNVQGIPFAFQNLEQVFMVMDGDLGDHLREEMRAKGIYALPKGAFDNGFQQLSITSKPVHTVADIQGMNPARRIRRSISKRFRRWERRRCQ